MREVAQSAGMAVGAALLLFRVEGGHRARVFTSARRRRCRRASPRRWDRSKTLETRLRAVIERKFAYFRPKPQAARRALRACRPRASTVRRLARRRARFARRTSHRSSARSPNPESSCPGTVRPYLARLLWMYQMGLILFLGLRRVETIRKRTTLLYEKTLKMFAGDAQDRWDCRCFGRLHRLGRRNCLEVIYS
jgi:hypothetical protein